MALMIAQNLRKAVPRPEVLPTTTSGTCTGSVTIWVKWTSMSQMSYHNGFKDPNMGKQRTADKRKQVTLTTPLKF
jgi:hypothetical protein